MFEKSLYDLIRGLRAHKGNERQYIQESLKECRNEAKSQDLDVKATAILKLIYLDMFGYDMSWASFHALEVMSSPKFRQKRVGYLAAIQSFRYDTDVLMLTTNLIKKDLFSPSVPETTLAISGLAHIASPSLARDLSPDLVAKLSHTSPNVRKKAVIVLYKCFLQSPELLRTTWPRLRDCLNDEDDSVVSATVNVICELARRNPRNYLGLAPQLFKLLQDGSNNWMTIKLIKLFATLTPLEPRLIKKLIPPITNLIQTTVATSLLYECINGLISGGLLEGIQGTDDGEELASVCATKLRGFLVEGDSNLKYVGLIALTKMVTTHAHLVGMHQDVILDCIDDVDISIRYRALELVVGMVNSDSLPSVVGRLMRQLKPANSKSELEFVELEGLEEEGSEEDMEEEVMHPRREHKGKVATLELPEDYKRAVMERILEMCGRDMYVNIADFEWYLDILVQLVRYCPPVTNIDESSEDAEDWDDEVAGNKKDVGEDIGAELRNVAVRVKSVRPEAVHYAEMLVRRQEGMFPVAGGGGRRVLGSAAWMVGEYSTLLTDPSSTLDAIIHSSTSSLPFDILAVYVQTSAKIYAFMTGAELERWTPARKSSVTLLTERLVRFLEPLSQSPNLEVQERAVEFLELFRLAAEAVEGQPAMEDGDEEYDPPLLLTQAIPVMFAGQELNPVAPRAQRKVPLPPGLNLDEPINPNLQALLMFADYDASATDEEDEELEKFRQYYHVKPTPIKPLPRQPASVGIDAAAAKESGTGSYQGMTEDDYLDADILARRRRERRERNKDDPFYIFTPGEAEGVTDADLENIPVMPLDLSGEQLPMTASINTTYNQPVKRRGRIKIAKDEGLDGDAEDESDVDVEETPGQRKKGKKKGLLQIDYSGLTGYSLEDDEQKDDRKSAEQAREEVERFRKEMERAIQRKEANVGDEVKPTTAAKPKKKKTVDGTELAKKKKKKVKSQTAGEGGAKPKVKVKKPSKEASAAAV